MVLTYRISSINLNYILVSFTPNNSKLSVDSSMDPFLVSGYFNYQETQSLLIHAEHTGPIRIIFFLFCCTSINPNKKQLLYNSFKLFFLNVQYRLSHIDQVFLPNQLDSSISSNVLRARGLVRIISYWSSVGIQNGSRVVLSENPIILPPYCLLCYWCWLYWTRNYICCSVFLWMCPY